MHDKILPLAALLAAAALPAGAQSFGDVAQVLSATPIYERGAPRQECWTEPVTTHERRPVIRDREYVRAGNDGIGPGAVVGAVIGGVIGHQFGGTSGARDKATGAGALIGGLIGNSADKDRETVVTREEAGYERVPVTREHRRCETRGEPVERIVGYDVRYTYNGREFSARLPYDPGTTLPVNVEVRVPRPGPSAPRY